MANTTEGTTRSEAGKAKKAAGKKPAAKPAPKKKADKKTQAPAKTATPKKTAGTAAAQTPKDQAAPFITSQQRHQLIAEAAYLRAERRGFSGGDPTRDWLEAEEEIDAALTAGKHGRRGG
ncbi:MAG TPA: DUF2934 domain-containing protein [Gammaproteobacteria bacterium]|nr:DUF2934 domain-containing protein [Gammaproteobacteria bacterium]